MMVEVRETRLSSCLMQNLPNVLANQGDLSDLPWVSDDWLESVKLNKWGGHYMQTMKVFKEVKAKGCF